MNNIGNDYGLWGMVLVNVAIFVGFAYSFFKPTTLRDWRSFGAYSAFVVALFAEMYGFPLNIYLLSGWLGSQFPGVNIYGHEAGHLWWVFTGQQGDPHFGVLQWPTLLTLAMFPVLVVMYVRLAIAEERDSDAAFGQRWREYAAATPRFVPSLKRLGLSLGLVRPTQKH